MMLGYVWGFIVYRGLLMGWYGMVWHGVARVLVVMVVVRVLPYAVSLAL